MRHRLIDSTTSCSRSGGLNFKMMMGTWCYDPNDGEVAVKIGVPIHDGLSFEAFEHCLTTILVPLVSVYGPQLKALIAGDTTISAVLR